MALLRTRECRLSRGVGLPPASVGQNSFVESVPFPVFEAAVRVAGEALHWKSSLKQIMRSSGVSDNAFARYSDLSKYQIFRSVWDDLENAGVRGRKVQHNLIAALATLMRPIRRLPTSTRVVEPSPTYVAWPNRKTCSSPRSTLPETSVAGRQQ